MRKFVRNSPTVYCGTHMLQDYENPETADVYICSVCGYVYDPADNDGVAFEDLPDDWRCPRCKQPKEKFNRA